MSVARGRLDRFSFVCLVTLAAGLGVARPALGAEVRLPPPIVDHVGTAQIFTSHLKDPGVAFLARDFVMMPVV